jgi:aminobenzoyl-glutamate transport protein
LPYALAFMVAGIAMVTTWVFLDLPLGPGATVHYTPPGGLMK